jgi:hypothetical protein
MSELLIGKLAKKRALDEEVKLKKQALDNKPTGLFSGLSSGKYFEERNKWREAYVSGFERGYESALVEQPTKGKPVNLMDMTEKQEQFYEEFLKLANKYNCCIEFDCDRGMIISDLNK